MDKSSLLFWSQPWRFCKSNSTCVALLCVSMPLFWLRIPRALWQLLLQHSVRPIILAQPHLNDIRHLDDAHVRRAGLCSPKGRLLASFLVWKSAEAVQLMVSADLRALVQQ